MTLEPDLRPRLAPGCRLHSSEPMLLVPEGALKLLGTSRQVLSRCDGQRSVADIVTDLVTAFPAAGTQRIQTDVESLLADLHSRGVVRW
jgi:pyrroloquinoline quinone biosynthesis protein D